MSEINEQAFEKAAAAYWSDEGKGWSDDGIRAAVVAYLAHMEVEEGWQDISTAPKDGMPVDLWHKEFGREADCYWGLPPHSCGEAGQYCDSDWHSETEGWVNGTLNAKTYGEGYTHFRKHPSPPSALTQNEAVKP